MLKRGNFVVTCDNPDCGKSVDLGTVEFQPALTAMYAGGFSQEGGGNFEQYCKDCTLARRADDRARTGKVMKRVQRTGK